MHGDTSLRVREAFRDTTPPPDPSVKNGSADELDGVVAVLTAACEGVAVGGSAA